MQGANWRTCHKFIQISQISLCRVAQNTQTLPRLTTSNDLATVAWQSGQISSNIYFVWPWQCSSCSARRPDSNQPCKVSGIPWVRWRCGSLIWLVESSLFKLVGVAWRTVFSAVPGELFEEFARCCISVSWLYFIFFKISPSPNGPNGTKLCKFLRHYILIVTYLNRFYLHHFLLQSCAYLQVPATTAAKWAHASWNQGRLLVFLWPTDATAMLCCRRP